MTTRLSAKNSTKLDGAQYRLPNNSRKTMDKQKRSSAINLKTRQKIGQPQEWWPQDRRAQHLAATRMATTRSAATTYSDHKIGSHKNGGHMIDG